MPLSSSTETPILVVDDCPEQRNLLRHTLAKKNYPVQTAVNGVEALKLAQDHKPRLIFSDIEMPWMDGFSLCRSIKTNPVLKESCVVLLSATWEMKTLIEGLECGADYYFLKPWDRRFLLNWTREILETPVEKEEEKETLVVQHEGTTHNVSLSRRQMLNHLLLSHDISMQQKRRTLSRELKPSSRNGGL